MEYKGKLYGKVGNHTFPLLHTTDDWEKMEKQIKELKAENEALKQAYGVSTGEGQLTKPDVIKSLPEYNEILYHAKTLSNEQFREYWDEVQGNVL